MYVHTNLCVCVCVFVYHLVQGLDLVEEEKGAKEPRFLIRRRVGRKVDLRRL